MRSKERGNFEGEQPNSGSEWDSLSEYEAEEEKSPEQLNRERQERKLMAHILMPESNALAEHDVTISPEAEAAALEKIASDDFARKDLNEILTKIGTPVHKYGSEAVFNSAFAGRDAELMLLAQFSDHMGEYSSCSAQDVEHFLKEFPSPADYESYAADFLNSMEESSSADIVAQFRQANENLKQSIYGKREEYFKAFKSLERRAYESERSAGRSWDIYDYPETTKMFHDSECEGDMLPMEDGSLQFISKEDLRKNDLYPTFKIEMGDTEIGVSRPFVIEGHESAIAYVDNGGKVVQRSIYRSNSQGTWRLLPDYAIKDDGKTWFGKGYSEEEIQLPFKMQAALSEISMGGMMKLKDEKTATQLFYGTAKRYGTMDDYRDCHEKGTLRGQIYKEMKNEPAVTLGEGAISDEKMEPERLAIHGDHEPNFNALTDTWTMNTGLYGPVEVRCYKSADKQLTYMFCLDSKGHAWIGGVEKNSKVTSGGINKEWVAAGDYGTPPYDYETQTDGYGDNSDKPFKDSSYVGMWANYLSKAPVIQRFCHSLMGE